MQAYELYFRKNKLPKFHRSGLIYDYQNTINQKNIFKKKNEKYPAICFILYNVYYFILCRLRFVAMNFKKITHFEIFVTECVIFKVR